MAKRFFLSFLAIIFYEDLSIKLSQASLSMAKRFFLSFLAIIFYMVLWIPVLLLVVAANPDPLIWAIIGPAIFIFFFPWFIWSVKLVWFFKAEGSPIPIEKLREEILSVNKLDIPVTVKEVDDKLIVTWKYLDAKWWELIAKTGARESYELVIKFNDKKKEVKLIDIHRSMKWKAGVNGIKFGYSFFRGIMLEYSIGKAWGLKENFTLGEIYDYKFNPSEIKNPVMNTILKSGWNVRFALY